ncbi:hypothetical protein O7635_15610 [Asanoa sp. WMMD1127]|uniref:hypothetical protein n=1 Tax=Asanoa sp. WMMD1127 TaxID=3016107 RepID=UPI0024179C18|nr:hypothetical protein [Asanoa sp. WMMD1127]MDG4823282.1 hypothetical protein [Asanoa sp. WMMD1127]
MSSLLQEIADFWDHHVADWLAGADPMAAPLPAWYSSYTGSGPGTPSRDGFPEPYIGDLRGTSTRPRMVVLGLNPGAYQPPFQSRDGIFAKHIQRLGSYSAWSSTGPYTAASGTRRWDLTSSTVPASASRATGSAIPE